MKRRVALKSLAVVVAGVVFLPGCDFNSKSSGEVLQLDLSPSQEKLLASLVEILRRQPQPPGF